MSDNALRVRECGFPEGVSNGLLEEMTATFKDGLIRFFPEMAAETLAENLRAPQMWGAFERAASVSRVRL